jgi:hypothetical protein
MGLHGLLQEQLYIAIFFAILIVFNAFSAYSRKRLNSPVTASDIETIENADFKKLFFHENDCI